MALLSVMYDNIMVSAEIIFRFPMTPLRIARAGFEKPYCWSVSLCPGDGKGRPLIILSNYTVGHPQREFQFRGAVIVRHSANFRDGTVARKRLIVACGEKGKPYSTFLFSIPCGKELLIYRMDLAGTPDTVSYTI